MSDTKRPGLCLGKKTEQQGPEEGGKQEQRTWGRAVGKRTHGLGNENESAGP